MKRSYRFPLFFILALSIIGTPSLRAGWLQEDIAVCTDESVQQGVIISPDSTGGTIVAWQDARNADIYAQRYDASGAALWTPNGVNVSDMTGTQKFPRIVADGTGGAFIIFESDMPASCVWGGLSVVVVTKLDVAGTVEWKKRIGDGSAVGFEAEVAESVPLARPDGRGGALVAWIKSHDLYIDYFCSEPPICCYWMKRDIFAQRIDASGNLLWGMTPVTVCADDRDPQDLSIAVDSSGAAYIAWCDEKPYGASSHIYAQKLDVSGNTLWGANGVIVAPPSTWQTSPKIAAGGDGGAIITWLDNIYATVNYYRECIQRIDSLGSKLWASGGILLTNSTSRKIGAGILPSGPGGSIIAWTDNASGVPTLFAQRLDAAGTPLWQSNGLMISDGVNTCANPCMALDGENGAVLAWEQISPQGGLSLRSIWGLSASDIYSVGDAGMILHYNGTAWSTMASGTTANIYGVWGSGSDNVYAVGKGGLILHYDGFSWSPMASGVATDLNDIWGSSADTIYAVGAAGTILRFDGTSWSAMDISPPLDANLLGVHGNGSNYAWAVGTRQGTNGIGALLQYNGTNWHCVYCAYGNYHGVWVSPDSCVYASGLHAGFDYGFLVRYDGTSWIQTVLTIRYTGYGMWGDRSDNVYAVFDKGYVAHFNGSQWTLTIATTNPLLDIWGTSGDDIWVVGKDYLIRHFENGAWITQYQAGSNIMVQRLDTLGTRMWTESGAPVSVHLGAQTGQSVVYGPPGAVLLAWSDNRNSNWDIYARKVSLSRGPLVATELMNFEAGLFEAGIRVAWQLSQCDEEATFEVSRAGGAADETWEAIAPAISRDGLLFSFVDNAVETGAQYRYQVQVSDGHGSRTLFETEAVSTPRLPLTLSQNVPNPFNPSTTIRYYLPERCRVKIAVYDVSGRTIASLADRDQPAGHYSLEWNGRDNLGKPVSSGIYFCRLQAGKEMRSRKMVLLR
jgi:hypothetical protein